MMQVNSELKQLDAKETDPALLYVRELRGRSANENLHKAYVFEDSNKQVNCSYIRVFLKQSACYTVTPDTHQWYRINKNEITDNHNIAICNDTTINLVPLPSAEPLEFNVFEIIVRLSCSQNQRDLPNDIQTQAISNTSIPTNNNI